jgi:hypothetical protein
MRAPGRSLKFFFTLELLSQLFLIEMILLTLPSEYEPYKQQSVIRKQETKFHTVNDKWH